MILFIFKQALKKYFFIYLKRESEGEHEQGRGRQRGNPKQPPHSALSCHSALSQDSDHDLS